MEMGGGRGGGAEEVRGGDTPNRSGGRGRGGTPGRPAAMEAIGGMPRRWERAKTE